MIRSGTSTILSGASSSGKTRTMTTIIENSAQIIDKPVRKWFYFYGIDNDTLPRQDNVSMFEGLPDTELLTRLTDGVNTYGVVLDDLLHTLQLKENRELLVNLFTRIVHHRKLVLFCLVQGLFSLDRLARINSQYFFLLRNPQDAFGVGMFMRMTFPLKAKFTAECYADATQRPYSHLFLDLHQETDDNDRIKANVLGNDACLYREKR